MRMFDIKLKDCRNMEYLYMFILNFISEHRE